MTTTTTEATMTVQTPGNNGKLHYARPSRFPGKYVLACSGRTMTAFPMPHALDGHGGECKKCQKLDPESVR
jgi:hypothetical protein